MRWVLRVLAVLIGVAGFLGLGAGVAAAAYVGRDDTVTVADQVLDVRGVALCTAPRFFTSYGPTLHLTARSVAPGQPVFIGAASSFQIADYLKDRQRTELTQFRYPGGLSTGEVPGSTSVAAPAELDIWSARQQGRSETTLSWKIPNGQYDLVVMRATAGPLGRVQLISAVELPGLFQTAVLIAVGGGAAIVLAVVVFVLTRRRPTAVAAGPSVGRAS